MRAFIVAIFLGLLAVGANAAAFEKEVSSQGMTALVSSEKPLAMGMNTLKLKIDQGGKAVEGDVVVKVFMPAMPGMPYMEDESKANYLGEGMYDAKMAMSMGGTWQMHIFITTNDGKKYRLKTILNF